MKNCRNIMAHRRIRVEGRISTPRSSNVPPHRAGARALYCCGDEPQAAQPCLYPGVGPQWWLAGCHRAHVVEKIAVEVRERLEIPLRVARGKAARCLGRRAQVVVTGAQARPRLASALIKQSAGILLMPLETGPRAVDANREPVLLPARHLRAHQRSARPTTQPQQNVAVIIEAPSRHPGREIGTE